MALCARKKLVFSKLDSNLTPREVEEAPIEGEVLDVDVVEEEEREGKRGQKGSMQHILAFW